MKIFDLLKKNKHIAEQENMNYGLITNLFTRQMFDESETVEITYDDYKKNIKSHGIQTLLIDNVIYETDHPWYNKSIEKLTDFANLQGIRIVVLKNTEQAFSEAFSDYEKIALDDSISEVESSNGILRIPIIINERKFNPIGAHKKIDVLYINQPQQNKQKALEKFHSKYSPDTEEWNFDIMTRENIEVLLEKIRTSKTLYICYLENVDTIVLRYFEIIGYLSNTYVVFDPDLDFQPDYGIKSESSQANISKIRAVINNILYKDKKVLPIQRNVFLNHSFMIQPSIPELLKGKSIDKSVEISAIISTNRPANVDFIIHQLNEQKKVRLQVVLVTHGFILSQEEKKYIEDCMNFELVVIEEDEETSLGNCLNRAIESTRFPVVTKMDDDDYYTSNYLIDQWIALKYSKAELVGKAAHFVYMEEEDVVIKREKEKYFNFDRFIMGATIMAEADYLKQHMFSDLRSAVDTDLLNRVRDSKGKIYQGHPYELCVFRGSDKGRHTWKVEDRAMLSSAEVICYGDPRPTISMD